MVKIFFTFVCALDLTIKICILLSSKKVKHNVTLVKKYLKVIGLKERGKLSQGHIRKNHDTLHFFLFCCYHIAVTIFGLP